MKFILLVEEDGYEFGYWDEINEEIRESIVSEWDVNELHRKLTLMDFKVTKKTLFKAVDLIESEKQDFVILGSKIKPHHLDTLYEDLLEIENG